MSNEHERGDTASQDELALQRDIRPMRRPARPRPELEPAAWTAPTKQRPTTGGRPRGATPAYLKFSDSDDEATPRSGHLEEGWSRPRPSSSPREEGRRERRYASSQESPPSSTGGKAWWLREPAREARRSFASESEDRHPHRRGDREDGRYEAKRFRPERRVVRPEPAAPVAAPRFANPRQVALDVLLEWERMETYAETLIEQAASRVEFAHASDRSLLNALVLGVLRHKTMLDIWIEEQNRRDHLAPALRWILRLGLFQLFKLGIPDHAAVGETVELSHQERAFVNAVLRSALREKDHLLAIEEAASLYEKYSLPDFLVERWRWLFGVEGQARLLELTTQPSETFVRLNRLRPWPEPPPGAEPVEGVPDFFRVKELPTAALEAGHCYAQDPATWFAPALLRPQPGHTVLDACAAPGGKTAILAQMMENQGTLIATDASRQRLRRLEENLQRLGVNCAQVAEMNWGAPELPDDGVRYDRILLDVPCSNTGVLRRRVDVRWRVNTAVIAEMAELQARILHQTLPRLKPNGLLCYSTCSLEPAENERQIERLLEEQPRWTLLEKKLITPHETGFDGAFIAVLRAPAVL